MRVIPKLGKCCLCCSLKTGSFSIALMLLVGSAVQTGYYGYLVKHVKPVQMCTASYTMKQTLYVDEVLPTDEVIPFWSPFYPFLDIDDRRYRYRRSAPGLENSGDEGKRTGGLDSTERSTVEQEDRESSHPTTTTKTTQPPKVQSDAHSRRHPTLVRRKTLHTYLTNCRKSPRPVLEIDINYLDFDINEPFKKDILHFNLAIFGTMMCFTPLLMYAVYKESRHLVMVWLLAETTLLAAGVAGTVAAAASLLRVLRVSVGIVTILNMAFHLAIDIYFVMVVYNFSEKLDMKDEDEAEEIQL